MDTSTNNQIPLEIHYHDEYPSSADPCFVEFLNNAIEIHYEDDVSCKIQLHIPAQSQETDGKQTLEVVFRANNKRVVVNCHTNKTEWDFEQTVQTFIDRHRSKLGSSFLKQNTLVQGCVESLATPLNYGTIKTSSNKIVYFHSDSLINARFDQLSLGIQLKFNLLYTCLGTQAINIEKAKKNNKKIS